MNERRSDDDDSLPFRSNETILPRVVSDVDRR